MNPNKSRNAGIRSPVSKSSNVRTVAARTTRYQRHAPFAESFKLLRCSIHSPPSAKGAAVQRLLITGASGQLGRALAERLRARAAAYAHGDLDIADVAAVERSIGAERPAVVLNAA